MGATEVSIIIVNYNTSELINDCISSIFDKTEGVTYEIIVVDNNTEKLSEVIDAATDSRVKLLQLPENVGFGRANNAGAQIASGRNLFFLNPDTILLNNAVKVLSDYLNSNIDCGACGGNLYDKEMHPTMSFHHKMPGIFWEIDDLLNTFPERLIFGKNRWFNFSDHPINVGYIQGADIMISNKLFKKLNGFSEDFFMYYEETDLCRRISHLGYQLVSVPNAKIIHIESASFNGDEAFNRKWQMIYNSRMIYLKRSHSKIAIRLSNIICRLFLFSRQILVRDCHKRHTYKLRNEIFNNSI